MKAALGAAVPYFAVVFAAGFVLGAVRVLALAPALGDFVAVLVELPAMLGVSFFAARWAVARFSVAAQVGRRLAMGGLAFGLLIVAEAVLAILVFGQTLHDFFGGLLLPSGAAGLAGQAVFGLMPLLLMRGEPIEGGR